MKSSSPNPFPEMAVCIYGGELTTAYFQSTFLARQELNTYLADYVTQNAYGAAIGVSGTHGAGKTHLLASLSEVVRTGNEAAVCLYARARVDPLEFYKQIVRQFPMDVLLQLTDTSRRRNVDLKNETSQAVF